MILFDAVGTLIYPGNGVIDVYHRIGREFGSDQSRESVKDRFKRAHGKFFTAIADAPSSDPIEKELWSLLVADVFFDVPESAQLFEKLWQTFADPKSWKLYDDVHTCLESIEQLGYQFGIASNFDSRIIEITNSLLPNIDHTNLYWSSKLGFRKPDPRFFQSIEQRVRDSSYWMIGDDLENDFRAARKMGWNAILVSRDREDSTALASRHLDSDTSLCSESLNSLRAVPQVLQRFQR